MTTTESAELRGATDEKQLGFAETHGRILVTHDADFLRLHQSGHAHAGIIYCHQHSRSIGDIIRSLLLIWENLEPEECRGQVQFI